MRSITHYSMSFEEMYPFFPDFEDVGLSVLNFDKLKSVNSLILCIQ